MRLGNKIPPDEINFAPREGMHFGFPYYNGNVPDVFYIKPLSLEITPPSYELPAHGAALGMKFYKGKYVSL